MIRFFWNIIMRFSKTVGCLLFIAGLCVASWFFSQRQPVINATQYRASTMLMDRISQLNANYTNTQRLVIQFKGTGQFPPEFSQAANKPQFLPRYSESKDFAQLRGELGKASSGKEAMKQYVMNRFETLVSEIQRKLLAHAASLAPAPTPTPTPKETPAPTPAATPPPVSEYRELWNDRMNKSESESRKDSLDDAKHYLDGLLSSAENPENKKTLEDSVAEVEALAKLLPTFFDWRPAFKPEPTLTFSEKPEPVQAEKVAKRLGEIRNTVRRAIISSWVLDDSFDQVAQLVENEERTCLGCEIRVRQLSSEMYLMMAAAITAGTVLGLFFLLIGDWTQKSSNEVIYHWCELIKDFSTSPKEVYDIIETSIGQRKVPGLESNRVFWHEGGALSAKREYLQLARERLHFEICAAPFGTGFFVSFRSSVLPLVIDPLAIFIVLIILGLALLALVSLFGLMWGGIILLFGLSALIFSARTALARGLADVDGMLMKMPLFAPLYELFLRPLTYYQIDSIMMYQKAVQGATAEALEKIFGAQKVTLLPEAVPAPVMEGIYTKRIY